MSRFDKDKLKVNFLEHLLGSEWEIYPAGGATGDAFFAQYGEERIFLKRNSSPFLAVLSAEGIVPKLIWTKRLENGDVITAQKWLDATELKQHDMKTEQVAKLLRKIHQSKELLAMLARIGKAPLLPMELFDEWSGTLRKEVRELADVETALSFMAEFKEDVMTDQFVVCHGDVHHNNWLLTGEQQLYLIDWDGAVIADVAIDIGTLLYHYVPRNEWAQWFALYGIEATDHLLLRMKWYALGQALLTLNSETNKRREKERTEALAFLRKVLAD